MFRIFQFKLNLNANVYIKKISHLVILAPSYKLYKTQPSCLLKQKAARVEKF
jgi:hypothetical protein